YSDPMGRVKDRFTVEIKPFEAGSRQTVNPDPRVILGNLVVDQVAFDKSIRRTKRFPAGNPVVSLARLRGLTRVFRAAGRLARLDRERRSILVLPELSIPRAWFR